MSRLGGSVAGGAGRRVPQWGLKEDSKGDTPLAEEEEEHILPNQRYVDQDTGLCAATQWREASSS